MIIIKYSSVIIIKKPDKNPRIKNPRIKNSLDKKSPDKKFLDKKSPNIKILG
jgi:hypothetical protein